LRPENSAVHRGDRWTHYGSAPGGRTLPTKLPWCRESNPPRDRLEAKFTRNG